MSGSSFSGGSGSSGSGFSGSSSGGTTGFSGMQGGYSGNTTTPSRGGGGASGSNQVPSTNNPFNASYINPYSLGVSTTSGGGGTKGNFNVPIYAPKTTATTSQRGGGGSTANVNPTGFSTYGENRATPYATGLSEELLPNHNYGEIQSRLRDEMQGWSWLKNKNNVTISVENGVVHLRGQVDSAKQRQLAATLVGFTPGIYAINNELTVKAP
jgi:hypothetical protein